VFFVISGYLITQQILQRAHLPPRQFLREFYLRRARRILPALLAMIAVSLLVAFLLFQPDDLKRFGRYVGLSGVFSANFAAWRESDYFNGAAGFAPLLHLWSIGVEEQFYLLYPLALLLSWYFLPRRAVAVFATAGALSFALCLWAGPRMSAANFYLGPTRAWELLLGAAVLWTGFDACLRGRRASLLAAVSLCALVASIVSFDRDVTHPGALTLIPALATAALLVAGRVRAAALGGALEARPLVAVGRISYSLYLWHFPVIVFLAYFTITSPGIGWRIAALAAMLALSVVSYRWVEQPIRRRHWLADDRVFAAASVASLAACALGGWLLWRSDGFPQRFDPAQRAILSTAGLHPDANRCMTLGPAQIAQGELCRFGSDVPDAPRVMLWGDSHALALLPAFEQLAVREGLRLEFAGTSACRPLPGSQLAPSAKGAKSLCEQFNAAMNVAARRGAPDVIVLAAMWQLGDPAVESHAVHAPGRPGVFEALTAAVDAMTEVAPRVCVVLDVPLLERPVPYALVMASRRGVDRDFLAVPVPREFAVQEKFDAAMRAMADSRLRVVDPKPRLCPDGRCVLEQEGLALFRDSNHLTVAGATYVADSLADCVTGLSGSTRDVAIPPAEQALNTAGTEVTQGVDERAPQAGADQPTL
jgi:peptidoglycan/LPS O-acetylase OafA/YrhL